jgi:molybdopterin-binding protein
LVTRVLFLKRQLSLYFLVVKSSHDYRIGEAAELLGIRVETIRRWEQAGKIRLRRTTGGQRVVPAEEVARLLAARRQRQQPVVAGSARNRFAGVITEVKKGGVAATVEIVAGPHRILALTTREAVEELGLKPGVDAVAVVKATNVIVELPA